MDLVAVHRLDYHKAYVLESCSNMLNVEWPRSQVLRMRSLNSSCDDFPICLALVGAAAAAAADGSPPEVLGHVRMTRIPTVPQGVWIESVILHPDLRGRGFGKYLMLKAEEFAKAKGFREAYLNTVDQQVFYSRIGYQFCPPVCAYGGNSKLMSGVTSNRGLQFDPPPSSIRRKPDKVQAPKWAAGQTANGNKVPAPPPPPPPPPAAKEASPPGGNIPEGDDELKSKCRRLLTYLSLADVAEPTIDSPLRCLKADAAAKAEAKKLDKDSIHRISLPKHYMKKDLCAPPSSQHA